MSSSPNNRAVSYFPLSSTYRLHMRIELIWKQLHPGQEKARHRWGWCSRKDLIAQRVCSRSLPRELCKYSHTFIQTPQSCADDQRPHKNRNQRCSTTTWQRLNSMGSLFNWLCGILRGSISYTTLSINCEANKAVSCSGQEEYERLRPLSYSKAHVILIAFAVDTPDSLENVTQKVSPITCFSCIQCKIKLNNFEMLVDRGS